MTATSNDPTELVLATLARVLDVDRATLRTQDRLREDLGMDSIASVELLAELSDRLHVDLETEEAMMMETVGQACEYVSRVVAQGQSR